MEGEKIVVEINGENPFEEFNSGEYDLRIIINLKDRKYMLIKFSCF
jgi:hypothetical protein